jgi:hypothetical protein
MQSPAVQISSSGFIRPPAGKRHVVRSFIRQPEREKKKNEREEEEPERERALVENKNIYIYIYLMWNFHVRL